MLGDTAVRFAPDGSFFTTGGTRGLKNTSSQPYDIGPSSTVSIWVRPASLPGTGLEEDVFRLYSGVTDINQIVIGLKENGAGTTNWFYTTSDASAVTLQLVGTSPVQVGNWYNIIGCKFDSFVQRLFVNAIDENTVAAGVPVTPDISRFSSVGLDGRTNTKPFDGDIHSVALWDVAVTQESVRAVYNGGWKDLDLRDDNHPCYNEGKDLKHWWRFGQGSTSTHSSGDDIVTDWVTTGGITLPVQVGTVEQGDILRAGDGPIGTSLLFDGSSAISSTPIQPIGLFDAWTISSWIKPSAIETANQSWLYIGTAAAGAPNSINFQILGSLPGDPLRVTVVNSAGATLKELTFEDALLNDDWFNIIATWDGGPDTLSVYKSGVLLVPDATVSGSGSQTDASRFIDVGGSVNGVSVDHYFGQVGHIGMWNSVLALDEILQIASQGNCVDLRYNVSSYISAENLERYYKPGEDPITTGRDFIDMNRQPARPLTVVTGTPEVVGDGAAPPFEPPLAPIVEQTTYSSVDGEYLQTSNTLVGIGAVWTIAHWLRRSSALDQVSSTIWHINAGSPKDTIIFGQSSANETLIFFSDDTGLQLQSKTWLIKDLATAGPSVGWEHFAFVYNSNGGAADSFAIFFNGAELTVGIKTGPGDPYLVKAADSSSVDQADTARKITISSARDGAPNDYIGEFYNWACWDDDLSPDAIVELYSDGNGTRVNLGVDVGDYTSSADLQHWYRFDDSGDRGEDSGNASILKNLLDEDSGVHTFVTNDFPGI